MKILMVSAPYKPTPPRGYAGIERVVFWYVRELVQRGHEVTTVCTPGSTVPGERLIWDPGDLPEEAHLREPVFGEWLQTTIDFQEFDILHDHTHFKIPSTLCKQSGIPYLNTVHLPNPPFVGNAVALSEGHKTTVSPHAKVIHLGVPVEDYPFEDQKGDYILYLGYIAPHKGVHLAIEAAQELDLKLILAGPYEVFPDYFHKEVEPELDEKRTWVGEVWGEKKLDLLSKARFIVLPILWEEPGSTVCFEALACGTPTIGYNRGALRDILIKPGIGTLTNSYPGLVDAMADPPDDYTACRAHVADNFDIPSRVDLYEQLYQLVLGGEEW